MTRPQNICFRLAVALVSLFCGMGLLGVPPVVEAQAKQDYEKYSQPQLFDYDELVALEKEELAPALSTKLNHLLTTPFVSNEAFYRGAKPVRPNIAGLGPSLRVVMWNIERGIALDNIIQAFTDERAFLKRVDDETRGAQQAAQPAKAGESAEGDFVPGDRQKLIQQLRILQQADVVVLNEVDWGMKRSNYAAVVRELGRALNMNWAYGVEFVEVDSKVLGLETFDEVEDPEERQELLKVFSVDKKQIRALHGTAVLSRYPIRKAVLRPFQLQGHDWYKGEKSYGLSEKAKRKGAILVGEKILREVRRGGRTSLVVTLDVPALEGGRLTIAAPHLENRTAPKNRRKQMEELLNALHEVRNPVIIAGDLNTTLSDGEPISVVGSIQKKLGSAQYWSGKAVKYATGVGFLYDVMRFGFKTAKFQNDPTASGVPFMAPNPERGLFELLEDFRFADGKAIDMRGLEDRTVNNTAGTLADSNQRQGKGFVPTFQLDRTVGSMGKFKLDWIFVKSYATGPRDGASPYRFAPHFARALTAVNYALPERLSDHVPVTVDLPFNEPKSPRAGQVRK